jgi:Tfp pilus assembly protein PilO
MNRSLLFIVTIYLIAALIGWRFVLPVIDLVKAQRTEVKVWQDKLSQANAALQKLQVLKTKYQAVGEAANKVLAAVPSGEDVKGLLVQVEELASQNGLILSSVSFASAAAAAKDEPAAAAVSTGGSSVKSLTITLALSGEYNNLKNFLQAAENNLRLMDISSINFGAAAQAGAESASQNYTVKMNTYYVNN